MKVVNKIKNKKHFFRIVIVESYLLCKFVIVIDVLVIVSNVSLAIISLNIVTFYKKGLSLSTQENNDSPVYTLQQCFSTFFGSRHPDGLKKIWRHP